MAYPDDALGLPQASTQTDPSTTSLRSKLSALVDPYRAALLAAQTWAQTLMARSDAWTFGQAGTLTVGAGTLEFPWPYPGRVLGVRARVGTAPTGAAIKLDVNKNGTTIFTTQANRPTVAVGTKGGTEAAPDSADASFATGDAMTIDYDQVGSTVAGADIVVVVRFVRT